MRQRVVRSLVFLSVLGVLAGCTSNFDLKAPTEVSISLSAPANTTLLPGQTAQFSATVSNASNTGIYWEVNNVVGGNAQVGTITDAGLYTAPSTFPGGAGTSITVTITAAAKANTSETATATVTLLTAPSVSVTPPTATVFTGKTVTFTATVTNSNNTGVTWQVNGVAGGSATAGTITAEGVYTAPATVPNPNTVTVTAVSSAYSGAVGSATVTIQALPPVVTVTPPSATVPGNTTQQFTATVTNTTNTAVTWEVNDIPGGNSTIGTISATGLYTAPSVIPNPATVTVSADSVADPSSIGIAVVTITTPEVVVVSPPSATVQLDAQQQFTGTSSLANDTLTWQVNGVTGGGSTYGTISASGLYTAPSSTPNPNNPVTIKAISGINPAIFGTAVVSIGTTAPSVSVTPPSPSVVINTTQTFTATVSPSNLSQAVQWQVDGIAGGNSTVGTITAAGVYTAPLLVPNPAAVTISAVSTAFPSLIGTATATVTLPNTAISVTVNPLTANLITGQSQPFTATVSPNNNPNVTWTVSGTEAGCTPASASNACGTIDASGNYTAPTTVPGGGSSANVTVTATSAADPTKSGTATVTVTPAPTPTVTITATTTMVCSTGSVVACTPTSATFTGVPHNFPANAQIQYNWTLGCINSDEDADYCGDPGNTTTGGDNGVPELDGPGDIQASGGGTAGNSVTNSTSVAYLPPKYVFQGSVPTNQDVCSPLGFPPGSNTSSQWAYVPLTVTAQDNSGHSATSQVTCIQVVYQFQ